MRNVLLALVAAAMVVAPSYLGSQMVSRLKMDISIVAIISLVTFLAGVFLLLRLMKE